MTFRAIVTAWFTPSSIRSRLLLLVVLSTLAVFLTGAFGIAGTLAGRSETDRMFEQGLKTVSRLSDLREALNRLARFEMDAIVNFESPPLTDEAKRHWQEAHTLALARANELFAVTSDPAVRMQVETLRRGLGTYAAGFAQLVARLESGAVLSAGVGNQLMLEHRAGYRTASQALAWLQESITEQTARRRDKAQAQAHQRIAASALVAALSVALTVCVGWLTLRAVSRPIAQARTVTVRIAEGQLDIPVPVMASSADEMATLMASLADMQCALRDLVGGVQETAERVSAASEEIASGSQDLSERTELASNGIHTTTSTIHEANEAAKRSAIDARRAADLAQGATQAASAGSAAVSDMARCMDGIADSASRIDEISHVIDAVATQTNLLALNAAVAAAHAGDEGRGFAVVAGEIRQLALRSARSAQEIKALIAASQERAQAGVAAVGRASASMRGILGTVEEAARLIAGIALATDEQMLRMGEVNQATGQLQHMTRQNAVLVEESAAAARSLREQARRLRRVAGKFKI